MGMKPREGAEVAILDALSMGIEIERYVVEGVQAQFRRRNRKPPHIIDTGALRVGFMDSLKRNGYITWPPFGKNNAPVLVELTTQGRQWLKDRS
jgi:hypothetical protein